MKKSLFFIVASLLLLSQNVKAQSDNGYFNHLAAGISLGTDGIGFDLAAPIGDYVQVRAGLSFFPKISYDKDVDVEKSKTIITDKVNVEGKLNMTDFKLLFDVFPIKNSSFHLTAGAFIGKEKLITAKNTEPFLNPIDYGTAGIKIGDYFVASDDKGDVHAHVKVNSFKPYLGLGFGRAVPGKHRFGVSFDAGVQFWGTPGVYTKGTDEFGNETETKVTSKDVDGDDDGILDAVSKLSVWPTLTLRFCGRIL